MAIAHAVTTGGWSSNRAPRADAEHHHAMKAQAERQRAAKIVPVGMGDINYRPIFENLRRALS